MQFSQYHWYWFGRVIDQGAAFGGGPLLSEPLKSVLAKKCASLTVDYFCRKGFID